MLKITLEYRKGILFVRLEGVLNKKTAFNFEKQVINKIKKSGINNIVYNIESLNNIDLKGINNLLYTYEICHKRDGKILICGLGNNNVSHKIRKNRLLNYLVCISDELSAFNLVKI